MNTSLETPPTTRLAAGWSRKWWVLAAGIVAAGVVAVLTSLSPDRYSATASITVSVAQTRAGQHEAALGSNELAAQYALLADSQPVKEAAARRLGSGSVLADVSAQPVAGYNLINVTATADNAGLAGRRASAVASSLVEYLQKANAAQASSATATATKSVAALDKQISSLQAQIKFLQLDPTTPLALNLGSLQSSLTSTLTSRQNILNSATSDITGGLPDIKTVNLPDTGSLVGHHLIEYTAIGLLIGLLVSIELSYEIAVIGGRKISRKPSGDDEQNDGSIELPSTHSDSQNGLAPASRV